jgi:hypothetical protein
VTRNASITTRSLWVTLLAAILALVFVVTSAGAADARKVRHKYGLATINESFRTTGQPFQPPDRFSCRPASQPIKILTLRYICTAVGSVGSTQAATFDLNDVLSRVQGTNAPKPPPGPGVEGTATPDLFQCHWDGHVDSIGKRSAEHFICEFRHNQQTRVFTMNEIVATNTDEVEENGKVVFFFLDPHDGFLPPVGRAVPTAVPAGADAAGEGSAAWLFGLVLAASGAMVGTVVIARRRFLHDS